MPSRRAIVLSLLVPLPVPAVDFSRDIRPLLSDACFTCHGPDAKARKAGLRLDDRASATAPLDAGRAAIVPGKPEQSELLARVTHTDPDQRMPPPEKHAALRPHQVDLLRAWIAEGAPYSQHWAFVAPTAPAPPGGAGDDAAIDAFLERRLRREGLAPAPEADRATLIRRATLDLTGLPPSLAEVDAFLADQRPGAWERVVDRLLASPHFGERMAVDWLDLARYADTNGYQTDETRDMSAWRDWVIQAFNGNLPFDRFTVEQLAGDLLPGATREQILATGFHRNHRINTEGGAIAEEFRVENVADRVATTGAAWLGLTLDCARCHDHKYDPVSQPEYYRFFAFFNTVDETGLGDRDGDGARGKKGNTAPLLELPGPDLAERGQKLQARLAEAEAEVKRQRDAAPADEAALLRLASAPAPAWTPVRAERLEARGARLEERADHAITASGPLVEKEVYAAEFTLRGEPVTAFRLELLPAEGAPGGAVGRAPNGNAVISEVEIRWMRTFDDDAWKIAVVRAASADFSQDTRDIAGAHDGRADTAWSVLPQVNQAHQAVFELAEPLGHADGVRVELRMRHEFPKGEKAATARFRWSHTASPEPHLVPQGLIATLGKAPDTRSAEEKARIEAFRRLRAPGLRDAEKSLDEARRRLADLRKTVPTAMVMREQVKPRETFLLFRGQYDQPRERVTPGVPSFLPPLPDGAPTNRLGLARWLVEPSHPLTARVAVNRLWQMMFGDGLVRSPENFGSQADPPDHPELLDWLAIRFVRDGWDQKGLLRRIALSRAYRRASTVTPEMLERDPENRLLARASRLRLPAEFLRDQALAVSGLLNPAVGGKAMFPYQPDGLWEELAGVDTAFVRYERSTGPELYRRSLYMFIKRTAPHPLLATFDAPSREVCVMKRQRTSTPLQALQTLNDPSFVEAARGLARVSFVACATPALRPAWMFRRVTGREPDAVEAAALTRALERQLVHGRVDPAAAKEFLAVGEHRAEAPVPPEEWAAHAAVASLILNLDESLVRP